MLLNHNSKESLGEIPDLRKQMSASLVIQAEHLKIETWPADVQSDVKSPQQSEKLHQQVDDEPAVVPLTNTVLYPGTMVVEAPDAVFTCLTVLCSHWLLMRRNVQFLF